METLISAVKDVLLVLVGAGTTYLAQSLLFKQQNKKDTEKVEGEIIKEAVAIINKSQIEINHVNREQDKEGFEKGLNRADYFITRGNMLFQLSRLSDNKIRGKFEDACRACDGLGAFVINYPDAKTRDLKEFKELIAKLSVTKSAFEEYCAEYTKLKK